MYKIICPFSLISSHEIQEVGFKGGNEIDLIIPLKIEAPFGLNDLTVEFEQINKNKFNVIVISKLLDTKDKQKTFLENFFEYLSFLINKGEHNPHYGTIFANAEWHEFKAFPIIVNDGQLISHAYLSDSWGMFSTRPVHLEEFVWESYHEVFRFYFDGLRAEHKKSKYFHWFLILEYLEYSDRYKILFNHNALFNEKEKQAIIDLAEQMSDEVKKSALKNLLSRTAEFRNAKLLKIINYIGVDSYNSFNKETKVTEEVIKKLVEGRNKIFHSGSCSSDPILWNDLFPLVTQIVEKISNRPHLLDK